MDPRFPTVLWGARQVTFRPEGAATELPPHILRGCDSVVCYGLSDAGAGSSAIALTGASKEQRGPGECAPAEIDCQAALVFAFYGDRIVLADIEGRGWCVPSGRIEPGEAADEATRREAWEEAGLTLGQMTPLGDTIFQTTGATATAAANYVAEVLQFDPIPAGSESCGIMLASREELPACYYVWDDLIQAIFDYAWERRGSSIMMDRQPGYSSHRTASSTPKNQ